MTCFLPIGLQFFVVQWCVRLGPVYSSTGKQIQINLRGAQIGIGFRKLIPAGPGLDLVMYLSIFFFSLISLLIFISLHLCLSSSLLLSLLFIFIFSSLSDSLLFHLLFSVIFSSLSVFLRLSFCLSLFLFLFLFLCGRCVVSVSLCLSLCDVVLCWCCVC